MGTGIQPDGAKDRYNAAVENRRVVIEPTDAGTANRRLKDGTPQWTTRLGHTYTTGRTRAPP